MGVRFGVRRTMVTLADTPGNPLARGISYLLNSLGPDLVVIGGRGTGKLLLMPLREELPRRLDEAVAP